MPLPARIVRVFQFQSGAIKSCFSSALSCFNSNLVRLKGDGREFIGGRAQVSIPIWCD